MEVIYVIAVIAAVYWLYKGYKWIKFKNKYPILSSDPPAGILEKGDYVFLGNSKVQYLGISNTDGIWFVFTKENSIYNTHLSGSQLKERLNAVYGKYGLKWQKVK